MAILRPDAQIAFRHKLDLVRARCLAPALAAAVSGCDLQRLDADLHGIVGSQRLALVAGDGLRGEVLFPTPYLLGVRPSLLGYYRLLYGLSQKEFYSKGPFGRFRALEELNTIPQRCVSLIPALCRSLGETAWLLYDAVRPLDQTGIHEMQLLTLGPQLRGAANNAIGSRATALVFELISDLLREHVVHTTDASLRVRNAAGRHVDIVFAADPDIAIVEHLPSGSIPLVSIEIKGGEDVSNVHNRIGEAEKSHQKARAEGYTQFWTIVRASIAPSVAARESPTTTHFFSLAEIVERGSDGHSRFRDCVQQVIGIAGR